MSTLKYHLDVMSKRDTLLLPCTDAKQADNLKSRIYYYGRTYPRKDGMRYSIDVDKYFKFVKVTLKK
jgi:hypothetical protein